MIFHSLTFAKRSAESEGIAQGFQHSLSDIANVNE